MRRVARRLRFGREVLVAVGLLVLIEVSLRGTTLPATCRWLRLRVDLDGVTPPAGHAPVLPRWARTRVEAALLTAAYWPAGDTCLRRCLLLGHRLRRLRPVLRIGVRRDGTGAFRAHSWLEIEGRSLDDVSGDFAVLSRLPR